MTQNQDQALRDLFKGASIVYAGLVIEIVIAFLAQVLAARSLSLSGFGSITTGTALLNIGAIVGGLGLAEGLTRYFPRIDEEKRVGLAQTTFLITGVTSLVLGCAVVFNAEFIAAEVFNDQSVTVSIRIFGAAIPFAAVLNVAIGGIRGQKVSRYRVYVENLLRPSVRFLLVIVATIYGLNQLGFAIAYAFPYVAGAIVALVLLWRTLPQMIQLQPVGRPLFANVTSYSLPFVVSGATGFLYRSADIFLILYFVGSSAVGVYGVAYAAARLMLMFSTAVNFLGAPVASELEQLQNIDDMTDVYNTVARWLILVSLPALMPLVLFPTEFISAIYRPQYASGATTLAVLAVGFWVHNILSMQGSLMRGLGQSRLLAFNSTVGAIFNVSLNIHVIPQYGILGAAIATVGSYLIMDLLMTAELKYTSGNTPFRSNLAVPVLLSMPLYGITWWLSSAVPETFLWLVFATSVFGIVYWLLVLMTSGLEPEDVMILQSAQEEYGINHWMLDLLEDQFG